MTGFQFYESGNAAGCSCLLAIRRQTNSRISQFADSLFLNHGKTTICALNLHLYRNIY